MSGPAVWHVGLKRHVRGKQDPHLGTMPSVSWAPGWHPQICLRGSREVHLYPKQLPRLAGQSNKQPLNVGTPWPLPTTYGRPPLALLPRRWVPGSADGTTHTHTRWQRWEQRRKAALAPTQAVSPAQTRPPRQHTHLLQLLVLLQLGLHLAQPLLDAAMSLSHLSTKNSISSSYNDPVLTARGL